MRAPSRAAEDYLKAIYHLAVRRTTVTVAAVADALDVAAPSVSDMLKRLAAKGMIERKANRSIRLTAHGREHAVDVVRRHRLLETLLVRTLGMAWDEVHAEAEVLEHFVSDRLVERIDAALGHPTRDPHGDPIPPKEGVHQEDWRQPLDLAPDQSVFRVERVSDRDSAALRHLADLGIQPGVLLHVEHRDPFGGPLWVRVGDEADARPLPGGLTALLHGSVREAAP